MFAVGLAGFWDLTMITLAIMMVAVALAMLIGVPLGSGTPDFPIAPNAGCAPFSTPPRSCRPTCT